MKFTLVGGTGTLGNALTVRLLQDPENEVVIFSRDELKQKQMAQRLGYQKRVNYVIGDVRDIGALCLACRGSDAIFHLAALKHVDTAEHNPVEAVKTNLLGSINVRDVALGVGATYCVLSSTDKAVDPINVYGMTKAISEQVFYRENENGSKTRFSVFRWGNVMNSRGSVLSLWEKTLKEEGKIYITDRESTRYLILIEDAVDFILKNYQTAPTNVPCIPSIKAAPIESLATALADCMKIKSFSIVHTGLRAGEKVHERLYSLHSRYPWLDSKTSPQYSKKELKELIHKSGVLA